MKSFQRALGFLRPYWLITLGAFVSLILMTGANLVSPRILSDIIDRGISNNDTQHLFWASLLLVGIAVVRSVFTFTQGYWSEKSSQAAAYDMRNSLFSKIQNLSFSYHDRAQTGQLMTRITSDVDQVRTFIGSGILQLVSAIVMLLGSIVALISMNWQLALLVLLTVPAIAVVLGYFIQVVRPMFSQVQSRLGILNTVLQENLAGVRVVQAFAREPYEHNRYATANQDLLDVNISTVRAMSLSFPLVFFISNLGTLIVVWIGGHQVIGGTLSLGNLVAFNSYLALLIMPLMQIGFISAQIARAGVSADRIFEIIDAQSEVTDKPGAQLLPAIQGQVTFENVKFGYFVKAEEDAKPKAKAPAKAPAKANGAAPAGMAASPMGGGWNGASPDDKYILKGVSFTAQPGMTVAIMGITGSGKSTIINLIPRFYDVSSGRVLVDGHDVRDVTLESLRSQIGIVLQDTTLFSGSIRENVAYGRPDASEHDIIAAAQAAQAHDFIIGFPDGYDTVIGERGVTLSGGQRQRIAIARAILRDPRILILDDSTSAVDAETEYQIQQALDRLMAGRTSFVIAQRISTVRSASLI
ncbi:MAG: ABC transporter ATP-binding protein, partial [Roseiflexaceae bacterium]|nr:ABC transporter ATP-binding protein [Roseiflexaceae bacterium]